MRTSAVCKSYFNGFQEISSFKKNTGSKNILATLKVLSYFTVVVLLGFAITYGAASLFGRVSKKQDLSSQDKKINDKAKGNLLNKNSNLDANRQLAEKIIALKDGWEEVRKICSEDFVLDPTGHLIRLMIKRGVGSAHQGDNERAFVISQIPGFIDQVSSVDYLRSFAENYFDNQPNKAKILKVFEKSLSSTEFQKNLESAVQKFNSTEIGEYFGYAEKSLRIPLTIYRQSENLHEYTFPTGSHRE